MLDGTPMSEKKNSDYEGTYEVSLPSGPAGTCKIVLMDKSEDGPSWWPSKYWSYTKPPRAFAHTEDPEKVANEWYFGRYPTAYEAYVELTEWAKSEGLAVNKV